MGALVAVAGMSDGAFSSVSIGASEGSADNAASELLTGGTVTEFSGVAATSFNSSAGAVDSFSTAVGAADSFSTAVGATDSFSTAVGAIDPLYADVGGMDSSHGTGVFASSGPDNDGVLVWKGGAVCLVGMDVGLPVVGGLIGGLVLCIKQEKHSERAFCRGKQTNHQTDKLDEANFWLALLRRKCPPPHLN